MVSKTNSPGTIGSPAAGHVPAGTGGTVAATTPPGPAAAASVASFGGSGGKRREDGLVPGSPEAKKADQDKDAKRKRDDRAAKSQANPPALPSPSASSVHTSTPPVNGASPLPGSPAPGQSGPVPWDPNTLKPLLQQIIDGAEQARIQKRRTHAVAVGLPGSVVADSARLAAFPGSAKAGLAASGSNGVAQIMNSLKISGKFQDPAIAVASIAAIVLSIQQSDAKFEELIAEFKKSQPAAQPAQKP